MYIWPFEVSAWEGEDAAVLVAPDERMALRATAALPEGLVAFLQGELRGGRLVLPADADYGKLRKTYNARFDALRPGGIVQCVSEQDVRASLEGVQRFQVPFRLRAGGHSFAGQSSLGEGDGLLILLAGLNGIRVDPQCLEAEVGSGCTCGALQQALDAHQLLLPLGGAPVGMAGYAQGGGFGEISRSLGMNSDRVLSARVMLADGRIVEASENLNHDLWWALRGGTGGNFGVLLSVRYRLEQARESHGWSFAWPIAQASDRARAIEALTVLQDRVVHGSGPELNASADLRRWPAANGGPPEILRLFVWGTWFGSQADMQALLKPLADIPGQQPFTQSGTKRMPVLRQARFVSELPPSQWKALVDDHADLSNPASTLTLSAWGGAIADYPLEQSSFIHRQAAFNIYVTGFWDGAGDERRMQAYLARWRASVAPWWTGGIYQNFADLDAPDYRASYWGEAFPALLAVKRKYDPAGLFRVSQGIEAPLGGCEPPRWPPKVVDWLGRPVEV
ncbi:FAD-binding oxidoreductase [Variovorax sp. JS1663]|uniref:FAD-binding oxidoreductase n=1 Tax=Variovorax sp. JS1663 TaxID=1851577 RepID=UPI000B344B07|nr:FAD-binding oxidoreductase [Variovorax sp. JS1663]OUM00330.1 hypothetical protein A8M77_21865 [Variovorax sp. JS1663]